MHQRKELLEICRMFVIKFNVIIDDSDGNLSTSSEIIQLQNEMIEELK